MPEPEIDLRSDTVTRPCPAMRRAMAEAVVGDDVYGEDPTVLELEREVARRVGKTAGLLVTSGTQANLVALLTHCGRGDAYLAADNAHTYFYEGGGAAVLGGIQPQPQPTGSDGLLDFDRVALVVRDGSDSHHAPTRLLCLENTFQGRALPAAYSSEAAMFAREHSLAMHLDGARIFNAAVALGCSAIDLSKDFDTVSVCLSKGLGAPVGSVLCGSENWIEGARRWRKVVGGGMRQAGVVAAAGLVAVRRNAGRLAEDHLKAERLACGIRAFGKGSGIEVLRQDTNMVFVRLAAELEAVFSDHLRSRGVQVGSGSPLRLVTHLDVAASDIDFVLDAIAMLVGRPVATDPDP